MLHHEYEPVNLPIITTVIVVDYARNYRYFREYIYHT